MMYCSRLQFITSLIQVSLIQIVNRSKIGIITLWFQALCVGRVLLCYYPSVAASSIYIIEKLSFFSL